MHPREVARLMSESPGNDLGALLNREQVHRPHAEARPLNLRRRVLELVHVSLLSAAPNVAVGASPRRSVPRPETKAAAHR